MRLVTKSSNILHTAIDPRVPSNIYYVCALTSYVKLDLLTRVCIKPPSPLSITTISSKTVEEEPNRGGGGHKNYPPIHILAATWLALVPGLPNMTHHKPKRFANFLNSSQNRNVNTVCGCSRTREKKKRHTEVVETIYHSRETRVSMSATKQPHPTSCSRKPGHRNHTLQCTFILNYIQNTWGISEKGGVKH